MTDFSPLDSALYESTPEKIAASLRYLRKTDAVMAALMPLSASTQAPSVEWFERWIRNNYQNHCNIAGLCDAMSEAAYGITKEQAQPAAVPAPQPIVRFIDNGDGTVIDTANRRAEGGVTWWNGNPVSQTLDAVLCKGQMMPEKTRFPVIALGERLCSPLTATTTEIARVAALTTPSVAVLDRLRTTSMSTAKTNTANCGRVVLRRLTPNEAERLMGFPDRYSAIPWRNKPADQCPDGPRYRALGSSWAVPVVRWIGERIKGAP